MAKLELSLHSSRAGQVVTVTSNLLLHLKPHLLHSALLHTDSLKSKTRRETKSNEITELT